MDADFYLSFDRRQQRMVMVQTYGDKVSRVAIRVCDIPAVMEAMRIASEGIYEIFERSDANLQILKVIYPAGVTPEEAEQKLAGQLRCSVADLQAAVESMVTDDAPLSPQMLSLAGLEKSSVEMYVRHNQHPMAFTQQEEETDRERKDHRPAELPKKTEERRPAPAEVSVPDTGLYSSSVFD